MVYATFDDVQTRYEKPIPADLTAFVQAHLDDAHALLAVTVPSLADRVTSLEVPVALARMVVVQAVLRVLRNPEGYKGEHGGEYGYYYGNGEAQGRVAFLPEELALLQPSGRRARLRSVGLADDALEFPTRRPFALRQGVVTDADGVILYNYAQQGHDS